MNANFVTIIKRIIAEQGESILANPQQLKGYIADYAAAESKAERLAFGRCIEHGAYNELKNTPDAAARQAVKIALAQRVRDTEGLDIALCNDAIDALEAAVFEGVMPAAPQEVGTSLEEWGAAAVAETPVSATPQYAPSAAPPASKAPEKKNTLRNVVIAVAVIAAGVCVYFAAGYRPVRLNEYDQIIFTQKTNNDELVKGNLALTLRDVKSAQKFIKKNFPGFDFEEEGYETDDYRNGLMVKEFANNPEYLAIYLSGIAAMAGKSQVYADLFSIDGELQSYFFSVDQEFSDRSGFEYYSSGWPIFLSLDSQSNKQITSIPLCKYLYTDTNEPYWEIEWDDDVPAKERLTLLKNFLNTLRYTKVFKNFARDFLKDVYTGIDEYQTIENIVDWYN
jgi:hypothetical protein